MPSAPDDVERRRDLRRRPTVVMRLALLALVPLVCLTALASPLLLSTRRTISDSSALSSTIERDMAVEELRLKVATERGLTRALVSVRTQPVAGLDEYAIEQLTGVALSPSLTAARGIVDEAAAATMFAEAGTASTLAEIGVLRQNVDRGQATRDEVDQTFERADAALRDLGRTQRAHIDATATATAAVAVVKGMAAWSDHLDLMHHAITETYLLFAFLAPDARWQSAPTRYEVTAAIAGAQHSLDILEASMFEPLRADWSALRDSSELTVLRSPPGELLLLAGVGRLGDQRPVDTAVRAELVRDGRAAVSALDGFRLVLQAHLLDQASTARSDAETDQLVVAALLGVAILCSFAVLVSTSRAIATPLRWLEQTLTGLRSGTRGAAPGEVVGPAEIAAAEYALRDLVDEVALVEAQAAAIGAGELAAPVLSQSGEMSIGQSLQRSVQALRSMNAQLKTREETARAILETAADAIWTIDGDALIRSANRATEDLLGWRAVDVVGAHFGSLLASETDMVVFELLRQQGSVRSEVQLRCANGTTLPALMSASVSYIEGDFMVTVVARDITERKELEGRLAHQATHDALTGLANRGAAITHLEQALLQAQKRSTDTALLFIDLDRFKLVNDSQGHRGGDALLTNVAERMRKLSHANVMAARLGGDEFVFILTDAGSIDVAVRLGQQVISVIEESYELNSAMHTISASVGISYISNGKATALGMLRDADHAVYQAKQRGGRCVQVFDDALREAVDMRTRTEMDLRRAIERNELVLYYQPILHAATGVLRGAEALVRWQHPTRGLVFPDTFIPLAEESMLIVDLGRWVLRAAMQQVAQWQRTPGVPPFAVSVNLSGRHIVDSDVVADVKHLLEQTNADPRRLKVEVTESRLIAEMDSSVRAFQRLRELGISISIDDFGTGYSGFTNVRSFPIDQVKIDRSFVKHLGVRHQDTAIVETVINLARAFGIDVVAEGVETDEQRVLLIDRNCDLIQGWLVAPAMPLDAFAEWMVRVLPEIQRRFSGGTAQPTTAGR